MTFWTVVAAVVVVGSLAAMRRWDRRRSGQHVTHRDVRVAEATLESRAEMHRNTWRQNAPYGPYGP